MEILKDKKFIIGGLAVVGVIALISYFKKPKKNSEGFFGANGTRNLEISPISLPITENNLPETFTRRVFNNGGTKSYCGRYDMIAGKKGFVYRLQLDLVNGFANAGALSTVTFANGNFYNSNGNVIITPPPTIISYSDFKDAWLKGQPCN